MKSPPTDVCMSHLCSRTDAGETKAAERHEPMDQHRELQQAAVEATKLPQASLSNQHAELREAAVEATQVPRAGVSRGTQTEEKAEAADRAKTEASKAEHAG